MSRARRQQYMLRTEASEADYGNFVAVCYSQEIALKVIEDYVTLKTGEIMPIENNQVLKRWEEKKWQK